MRYRNFGVNYDAPISFTRGDNTPVRRSNGTLRIWVIVPFDDVVDSKGPAIASGATNYDSLQAYYERMVSYIQQGFAVNGKHEEVLADLQAWASKHGLRASEGKLPSRIKQSFVTVQEWAAGLTPAERAELAERAMAAVRAMCS